MTTRKRYSTETKDRAVRLLKESASEYPSEWAAMKSIAEKIGCNPETLRSWVRRAEVDAGERVGTTTEDKVRIRELEREVRELKRANEIRRSSTAH